MRSRVKPFLFVVAAHNQVTTVCRAASSQRYGTTHAYHSERTNGKRLRLPAVEESGALPTPPPRSSLSTHPHPETLSNQFPISNPDYLLFFFWVWARALRGWKGKSLGAGGLSIALFYVVRGEEGIGIYMCVSSAQWKGPDPKQNAAALRAAVKHNILSRLPCRTFLRQQCTRI